MVIALPQSSHRSLFKPQTVVNLMFAIVSSNNTDSLHAVNKAFSGAGLKRHLMAAKIMGRLPQCDCKSVISRNPRSSCENIRRSFICSPLHVAFMCHG